MTQKLSRERTAEGGKPPGDRADKGEGGDRWADAATERSADLSRLTVAQSTLCSAQKSRGGHVLEKLAKPRVANEKAPRDHHCISRGCELKRRQLHLPQDRFRCRMTRPYPAEVTVAKGCHAAVRRNQGDRPADWFGIRPDAAI